MCQNLNALKSVWASWTYNINIDEDFSTAQCSQSFCGIGRLSFHASLKSLDDWMCHEFETKPLLAVAYLSLTGDMERYDSQIQFVYADEEAGCLYISTDEVTFAAENGHLVIKQSCEVAHNYTWENYLALDFGGEEQLAELVDGLLKIFALDKSKHDCCRGRVEEWVNENTLPHTTADSMDEEAIVKFSAAFTDLT